MNDIDHAVIIATASGGNLGHLTVDRPRPMLPVLGKPVVVRVMDRLREAGITKFTVVMGEKEGEVAAYLNSQWVPDCKVQIVLQPSSRGVADALACAAPTITGPFLLASSNHLAPPDQIPNLIRRFRDTKADMVLSLVTSSEEVRGLPTAKLDANDDQITAITLDGIHHRRTMSVFMLYACGKRILNHTSAFTPNDYDISAPIQALITSGARVYGVTADWHMQLSREIDLLSMNKRFLREGRDTHILSEIPGSVHIIPPVRIDPKVSVGQGAKIGPNVYLESGSYIGQEAVVWDSMILQGADIGNHEVVHGQIVMRRARISEEPLPEVTRPRRPSELDELLSPRDTSKKDKGQ